MKFTPQQARDIRAGRKTQHRRPIKLGETEPRYKPGTAYLLEDGHDRPDDDDPPRVLITSAARGRLGDLTFQDARAEGFKTTDDFKTHWAERHKRYNPDQAVWVFELEIDTREHPRLLHRHSERGYTEERYEALEDEPEGVDSATLKQFAKTNTARHAAHEETELRFALAGCSTSAQRADVVLRYARKYGVDTRSTERLLDRKVQEIVRQIQTRAA